jgi:Kef-type K+ transport system membrane component KefB
MVDVSIMTGFVTKGISGIVDQISHLPMSEAIIFDIAVILIICAVFAFIARMLRQPLIPAYVLAGLIIGPLVLGFVKNTELILAFSEIGIAFLLFTAGLEISFRKIKEANLKKIALIGILQVAAIFGIGILAANFLGLDMMQAVYIGIVMAFGSTMVVIKLLADKGELVTLYGRLILGILLLQDLVAIFAIVIFMSGGFAVTPIVFAIVKLFIILGVAILLQKYVLNKLFRFAARSTELLLLSSLAVLFLFIILTYLSELSIVIGAFIAGVSLANSPFKLELESRITPLRDFFAILFFVALGMQVVFSGVSQHMNLFWFLLGVAIIAKPLITVILLRITGYRPRTSFLTAISLAQLSEFSLIIGMLGMTLGVIDMGIFSTIILATIITMSITPYFIQHKNTIYQVFKYPLKIFKFLPMYEDLEYKSEHPKSILLLGAHRMGSVLLKELVKKKEQVLVIDYNPEIVSALMKKKISTIYGDVCSPEVFKKVDVEKLKMVISTVPDYDENIHLLKRVKAANPDTRVIVTATRISEAIHLYKLGADYVIMPKIVAGEEIVNLMRDSGSELKKARKNQLKHLRDIHNVLY